MEVIITIVVLGVLYISYNFSRGTNKVKKAIFEEIEAVKNGMCDYHLRDLDCDPEAMAKARLKNRISILVNDRIISRDDILPNMLDKHYDLLIEAMQKRKDHLTRG